MDVNKIINDAISSVIGEAEVGEVGAETATEAKEDLKSKVIGAGKKVAEGAKEAVGEVKEKAEGLSDKVVELMKEHPGLSAAAAAALAAGVGGVMLRKRLKAASKK